MNKKNKKRLDTLIQEKYPELSKTYIQSLIMQGKVSSEGQKLTKAGMLVKEDIPFELTAQTDKFVCRAGYKLEKALDHFGIDVKDLTILDAGLSTGGFTDCLLQRGAKKVYGVDVGYGQVHEKIRHDNRVVVMERTNLRHLEELPEQVDLITLDLSFISVLKVMDSVCMLLKTPGQLVVLIKPQFEADRADISRGGLVKDPTVHERVIQKVAYGLAGYGFVCKGVIESPILGATGNKEFLGYFVK